MSKYGLGVLSGSLRVVCHREYNVEALGLRRSGAIELSVRLFVIPYDTGSLPLKNLTSLCFTKNGEVIKEIDRKRLVAYNLEGEKCIGCSPIFLGNSQKLGGKHCELGRV